MPRTYQIVYSTLSWRWAANTVETKPLKITVSPAKTTTSAADNDTNRNFPIGQPNKSTNDSRGPLLTLVRGYYLKQVAQGTATPPAKQLRCLR